MSLLFRDNQGNETHIAGLNGVSGELIPSVSLVRTGTVSFENVSTAQWATASVVFDTPMPDADYEIIVNALDGYVMDGMTSPLTISNKTINGFSIKIYVHVLTSFSISYTAFKLMTDESRALDEAAIQQNASDIATINDKIPSTASSSNKLVSQTEKCVVSKSYSGATYSTALALFNQLVTDIKALDGNGGAIGCVWTGKSYFSGTFGRSEDTGEVRLHFENAQSGYTECKFSFTSTGAGTATWFNDTPTSTVTSGSTAPVTSGAVYNRINTAFMASNHASKIRFTLKPFSTAFISGFISDVGAFMAVVKANTTNSFSIVDIVGSASQDITISNPSNWTATYSVNGTMSVFGVLNGNIEYPS